MNWVELFSKWTRDIVQVHTIIYQWNIIRNDCTWSLIVRILSDVICRFISSAFSLKFYRSFSYLWIAKHILLSIIMTPKLKIRFKQKILDRHTGASPADLSRRSFDVFRSDLSSFNSFYPLHYAKHKWSKCLSSWQPFENGRFNRTKNLSLFKFIRSSIHRRSQITGNWWVGWVFEDDSRSRPLSHWSLSWCRGENRSLSP